MSRQGAEDINRERGFEGGLLKCCLTELFQGKTRSRTFNGFVGGSFAFKTAAASEASLYSTCETLRQRC